MTNNPSPSDSQAHSPHHSVTRSGYPPPKPPPRYARRLRRRTPSYAIVIGTVLLGSLILMIVITAGALGLYGYYQITERIVPGVQVLDVQLDGMTPTQSAIALHKYWNLERQIIVSDGIHTLAMHPSALGISVDSIQTAQAAYQVGHSGEILSDLDQIISSHQNGHEITPIVTFDEVAARDGLESLASQISQAPKDATIRLQGSDLVAIPGELGYTINIEKTLSELAVDPYSIMISGSAQIFLKPIPPRIDDVSAAMEEARELLEGTVSIHGYDPITNERVEWTVAREDISKWLTVIPGEGGPQVALDESLVSKYLGDLSESIGPERWIEADQYGAQLAASVRDKKPTSVLIKYNPTTYLVKPGDTLLKIGWNLGIPFWMILQANPGLDPDRVIAGSELVIPSKDDLLPLPIVPNKRIVMSISKQRLMVYEDGKQIKKFLMSTGIDRSPTQPGVFQVQTHKRNAYASVWDLYMPNFLGIYESWPGFMNGIHGLPTLSSGTRLWANILGQPASYGCIILDLDNAKWLYNWAEDGVVVEIRP